MIKDLLKKIIYGPKASSDSYVDFLRKNGANIGDRVIFYAPNKTSIDITRPYLISIGNDVQITEGVTILTHGYEWSVYKGKDGLVLGSAGTVEIGNNVFIGNGTTILKNVKIGNNVIIGANSLVTSGEYPDNTVICGNPAKVLMSYDQYKNKIISNQYNEASILVKSYFATFNKIPPQEELAEFFWLFSKEDDNNAFKSKMELLGNYDFSKKVLTAHTPLFNSYDEFINSILHND